MGYKWVERVLEHSKLDGFGQRLVLVALATHANNDTGICWPDVETLAGMARISDRQVQKTLRKAADLGELEITDRGRQHKSNIYKLIYPPTTRELESEAKANSGGRVNSGALEATSGTVQDAGRVNSSAARVNSGTQRVNSEQHVIGNSSPEPLEPSKEPSREPGDTPLFDPTETDRIADALATLTESDPALPPIKKQITAEAKMYAAAGYTAEHVKACEPEWDARRRKGETLIILDARDMMSRAKLEEQRRKAERANRPRNLQLEAIQRAEAEQEIWDSAPVGTIYNFEWMHDKVTGKRTQTEHGALSGKLTRMQDGWERCD